MKEKMNETLIYRMVWFVDRFTMNKKTNGVIVHYIKSTDIATDIAIMYVGLIANCWMIPKLFSLYSIWE